MLLLGHSQLRALDLFQDVDDSYGMDPEAPEPQDEPVEKW